MMYRVVAIVSGALALAACSSVNFDAFKPAPLLDTVRFESVPPGAEARTSNGQTCHTPCALALPTNAPLTVTFTLDGYLPETDGLDPLVMTGSPPQLQPNPIMAELTAAPPPPKATKKKFKRRPAARKPAAKKPGAKTAAKPAARKPAAKKPAASAAPAPAPMTAAPPQQPAPSPWPAAPPPPQH
jgi:hypothetical protein